MSDLDAGQPQAGESGLPGLQLFHDFHLNLPHLGAWGSVAEAFRRAGAELQSVQLIRKAQGFSGRCRVAGVEPEAARRLSDFLIESGTALHASVEHLMLRSERQP